MKIRKHKGSIELVAENIRETRLLRELFQGVKGELCRMHSFGYDRKMPKRKADFEWWMPKRQVLVFRLEERLT